MITAAAFRKLAHSLGDVTEAPHFERTAFLAPTGVMRKGEPVRKIFATFDKKSHRVCLNLTPADQDLYSLHDNTVIYPVPNKWGKRGWTYVDLKKVRKTMLRDGLKAAIEAARHQKINVSR